MSPYRKKFEKESPLDRQIRVLSERGGGRGAQRRKDTLEKLSAIRGSTPRRPGFSSLGQSPECLMQNYSDMPKSNVTLGLYRREEGISRMILVYQGQRHDLDETVIKSGFRFFDYDKLGQLPHNVYGATIAYKAGCSLNDGLPSLRENLMDRYKSPLFIDKLDSRVNIVVPVPQMSRMDREALSGIIYGWFIGHKEDIARYQSGTLALSTQAAPVSTVTEESDPHSVEPTSHLERRVTLFYDTGPIDCTYMLFVCVRKTWLDVREINHERNGPNSLVDSPKLLSQLDFPLTDQFIGAIYQSWFPDYEHTISLISDDFGKRSIELANLNVTGKICLSSRISDINPTDKAKIAGLVNTYFQPD